jgi:glycine/D-amino acid oxidase-like deaminating enzyme
MSQPPVTNAKIPKQMFLRQSPFWSNRFPKARRPAYPRLRGHSDADVVIVGGGLAGTACAAAFGAAGVRVVLLESETIGGGATAGSVGLVREDLDASFAETSKAYGLRSTRVLWQGFRRASLDLAAALRRMQIRCDLAPQDLVRFAQQDPRMAGELRAEYKARRDAGLEHSWVSPAAMAREAAIETGGGIRTRGASLDPYRACLGLAAAAAGRGAAIHEASAVTRIRAGRKQVEVTTEGGSVTAQSVLVATAAPLTDLRALRRHLRPVDRYTVVTGQLPAVMRREVGRRAAALRDGAAPPHMLRWLKDDRVLFTGGDQPVVAARARDKALVQRTWQLMYELSVLYPSVSGIQPEWAWSATRYGTVDGLPFMGTHRNFPRHLFAMGEGRHGAAFAWLAARVLLRHYQGAPEKGDEIYGFARVL